MKIKQISLLMLLALILFTINVNGNRVFSWYCIRNKNHMQPELGKDLKIAEGFDVYWCDKNHTDYQDEDKVIYLTFDAGYENGNIEKILDVLKEENVCSAFFVLDNVILKNKQLVKRMIDEGHIVANHTLKHKDMSKINNIDEFEAELTSLEQLYKESFNVDMKKYYRPPEGKFSEENLRWAQDLGYKTVMWSFAYADWDNNNQPSKEYAMNKILDNLHNGEVILMHPTSDTNAKIMSELIKKLKATGFRFGDLDELCAY